MLNSVIMIKYNLKYIGEEILMVCRKDLMSLVMGKVEILI